MEDKQGQRRGFWIVILFALAGGGFLFREVIINLWLSRAFSAGDLQEYEELFSWDDSGGDSSPERVGKVVVVRPSVWQVYREGNLFLTSISPEIEGKKERQVDPPRLDDSYFELDSSVRAASPDEVGTVILCATRAIKEGHYVHADSEDRSITGYAHRREAVLKIYDFKKRQFLGEAIVQGEAAPEITTTTGSHTGKPPDIASFIRKMRTR